MCARVLPLPSARLARWSDDFPLFWFCSRFTQNSTPNNQYGGGKSCLWLLCIFFLLSLATYWHTHANAHARKRGMCICFFSFVLSQSFVCISLFLQSAAAHITLLRVPFLEFILVPRPERILFTSAIRFCFDRGDCEWNLLYNSEALWILPNYSNDICWYGLVRFVLHNRYWTVQ